VKITRRRFGSIAGGAIASLAGGACGASVGRVSGATEEAEPGRLTVRPKANASPSAQGRSAVGLDSRRDAILQLPANAPAGPLPLLVLLHGANGTGEGILRRVGAAADEAGVAVLAPDSRGTTWDAIRDDFGNDVAFLDRALERTFDRASIDPARIAVGGFSDGATYAISLGLINGDLLRRVVAFSPGFVVDGPLHGHPQFFVSHGTADPILPIDRCSRVIVPRLRQRGYDVTFREFEGRHEVPAAIAAEGMRWIAQLATA
jgi:phospholipase/carboxylesterase